MALLVAALLHSSFSFLDHAFSQFKKLYTRWNSGQARSCTSKSMPCQCMSSSQVLSVCSFVCSEGGKLQSAILGQTAPRSYLTEKMPMANLNFCRRSRLQPVNNATGMLVRRFRGQSAYSTVCIEQV